MRTDMHKVIVERPRVSHYSSWLPAVALKRTRNVYRKAKHFKLLEDNDVSDDFCGNKRPMKSKQLGYRIKMFNENLKPLWRFLAKRIGQPWDEVYSEVCQNLKGSPTLKQHVLLHISFEVVLHTVMNEKGRVLSLEGFQRFCDTGRTFYVHPHTGLLCRGVCKSVAAN